MLVRSLSKSGLTNLANMPYVVGLNLRAGQALLCSKPQSLLQHCEKCRQNSSLSQPYSHRPSKDSLLLRYRRVEETDRSQKFGLSCATQGLKKSTSVMPTPEQPGMITNLLEKVGVTGKLRYNRFKVRVAGLNMYKSCADGIDAEKFFQACGMRDTLFSWFLVTELHVWMCMARLKQEGREGKYMTHYLVMSMWHDIQERGKVMGISSVKMRDSLSKMVEQFNGALFAYDEGLLSSDRVLAAALWRNIFLQKCDDPEQLLDMVAYIRKQMQYLDALDSAKLLQIGRIKWLPFEGGINRSSQPLEKAASLEEELSIPDFDKVPAV